MSVIAFLFILFLALVLIVIIKVVNMVRKVKKVFTSGFSSKQEETYDGGERSSGGTSSSHIARSAEGRRRLDKLKQAAEEAVIIE